jgi:hypothetical protein
VAGTQGRGAGGAEFRRFYAGYLTSLLGSSMSTVAIAWAVLDSGSSAIGYAIDGPLAGALGTGAVFGIGAVYGLLSSAAVLALPDIRAVRWRDRSP